MLVIGIDPGVTGALAFVDPTGARVHDAPTHQKGKRRRLYSSGALSLMRTEIIRYVQSFNGDVRGVIEYASTRPGESAARSFGFGLGYGIYLGLLEALSVRLTVVTPKKWKGELGLSRDKRESLKLATKLYPDLAPQLMRHKDNGRAEALLLAHYGLRGMGV